MATKLLITINKKFTQTIAGNQAPWLLGVSKQNIAGYQATWLLGVSKQNIAGYQATWLPGL